MCGAQTILVVDDDRSVRALHEAWLQDRYDVVTAADGREALNRVEGVDVVLLDREMPGLNGTAVAERIDESDVDPFVVIVSGVEPDFDIVDLPIDEYMTKPVTQEEIRTVVETMLARAECQDRLREFYSLAARKAALEVQKGPTELAESDEYSGLTSDLEATRVAVEELLAKLDGEWQRTILWALDNEAEAADAVEAVDAPSST